MNKFATFVRSLPQNPQFIRWAVRIILLGMLFSVLAYFYATQIMPNEEVLEEEVSLLPDIPPTEPVSFDLLPENTFTEIPNPSPVKPVKKKPRQITEDEQIALSTADEKRQLLNKQLDDIVEHSEQKYSEPKTKKEPVQKIAEKIKNFDDQGELFIEDEKKPYNAFQKDGFIIMLGLTAEFNDFQNNNVVAGGINVNSDSDNEIEAGINFNAAYQKNIGENLSVLIGLELSPHIGQKTSLKNSLATTDIERDYTVSAYLQPQLQISENSAISFKTGLSRAKVDVNNQSVDYDGYVFGLGYRHQLKTNLFWFGEFNQYIFSDENTSAMVGGGLLQQNLDLDSRSLNLGLGYQF